MANFRGAITLTIREIRDLESLKNLANETFTLGDLNSRIRIRVPITRTKLTSTTTILLSASGISRTFPILLNSTPREVVFC